jgi:GMP synthase (glutamine-hydrolysing)
MKNVLVLKAGEANPQVRVRLGDYERWFADALLEAGARPKVVQVHLGERPPGMLAGVDQVMMTGSPRSVTEHQPWMRRAGELMLEAAAAKIPVLGVCFGHQLLGELLGVQVRKSPLGREIGTVEVALTPHGERDPLFAGLPRRLWVQTTHEDELPQPPVGAALLATNAHSKVQAFAVGEYLRAVQFHPEVTPEAMRALIAARAQGLEGSWRGAPPGERVRTLLCGIRSSPLSRRVLLNFVRAFG